MYKWLLDAAITERLLLRRSRQTVWIHAPTYIIVNTDSEERDRKLLNGKGSLGHSHICFSLAVLLTF